MTFVVVLVFGVFKQYFFFWKFVCGFAHGLVTIKFLGFFKLYEILSGTGALYGRFYILMREETRQAGYFSIAVSRNGMQSSFHCVYNI